MGFFSFFIFPLPPRCQRRCPAILFFPTSRLLLPLGVEGRYGTHRAEQDLGGDLDGWDPVGGARAVVVVIVVEPEGRVLGAGPRGAGLVAGGAGVVVVVVGRHSGGDFISSSSVILVLLEVGERIIDGLKLGRKEEKTVAGGK